MRRRKSASVISALVLATQLGSPLAAQEPNLEQLNQIETLLSENDVAGLRTYLEQNPELLDGDTEIARLLEEFLRISEELPAYLSYEDDLAEDGPNTSELESGIGNLGPAAGGSIY